MRNAGRMHLMKVRLPTHETQHSIDLPATFVATEWERQLTTARASQTAGLNEQWQSGKLGTGSRVCALRAVSRRQLTFPGSVAKSA